MTETKRELESSAAMLRRMFDDKKHPEVTGVKELMSPLNTQIYILITEQYFQG
jgi:hypothetical protein